jgi:DNA-binding LacI/PurR family transcriptional regulator
VPDDLSIAGFDDSELAEFVHPGLTTVRADPYAFGEAAARTLNQLVDGDSAVQDVELPPARLIIRRSTAKLED